MSRPGERPPHDPPEADPRPRLLVTGSVAAMLVFSLVFFVVIPVSILITAKASIPPGVSLPRVVGAVVTLLSLAVVYVLVQRFVQLGRGTPSPLMPPIHLVETGVYGRMRNPMYLAYAGVIVGQALLVPSWLLAYYAGLFLVIAHVYVVRVEEPQLRSRFGEAYARYCEQVPRWWPRLGRRA